MRTAGFGTLRQREPLVEPRSLREEIPLVSVHPLEVGQPARGSGVHLVDNLPGQGEIVLGAVALDQGLGPLPADENRPDAQGDDRDE